MANIRISALPSDTAPSTSDVVALDGATTRKATLEAIADATRPWATQAEAEAGVATGKVMDPLLVAQAIAALTAPISGLIQLRSWTTKTANYSAQSGDRLQCNTTGGDFTVTMPSPMEGAEVWVYHYGSGNLTLDRNGATFDGDTSDLIIAVDDVQLILVYRNGTWRY